jgi:hypothetical protein
METPMSTPIPGDTEESPDREDDEDGDAGGHGDG